MPEQRDGLRYLADIRKIGVGTSLDAVWSGVSFGTYDIDMLALNRPQVELKWNDSTTDFGIQGLAINQEYSPEIGLAKIHFGEMSKILAGEKPAWIVSWRMQKKLDIFISLRSQRQLRVVLSSSGES